MRASWSPVLCSVLLLFACDKNAGGNSGASGTKTEPLPRVDSREVRKTVAEIEGSDGDEDKKAEYAAKKVSELEKERLGKFAKAFEAIAFSAPEQRSAVVAKAVEKFPTMLDAACGGDGTLVMESLAKVEPEKRNALLWEGCKLERHGLLTKDEALAIKGTGMIMAYMAYAHLEKNGDISADEKKLLQIAARAET